MPNARKMYKEIKSIFMLISPFSGNVWMTFMPFADPK